MMLYRIEVKHTDGSVAVMDGMTEQDASIIVSTFDILSIIRCTTVPCGREPADSDEYRRFVDEHNGGEDGPDTYEWDTGIPP